MVIKSSKKKKKCLREQKNKQFREKINIYSVNIPSEYS